MPVVPGSSSGGGILGSTVEIAEIETLAKGSLIVGDGSGAPSVLAVGASGTALTALASEPTGLIWAAVPTGSGSTDYLAKWTSPSTLGSENYKRGVAALTDAATIATDASSGTHFRVTLGGNRTLGNPTNPTDGQKVVWEFIQDGTGSRTIALDTKFAFGTDITGVTLTTTASKRDFMGAIYNSTADKWFVTAFVKGY